MEAPIKTIEQVTREHVINTYNQLNFNKHHVAEVLGISVKSLYDRMRRYQDQGYRDMHGRPLVRYKPSSDEYMAIAPPPKPIEPPKAPVINEVVSTKQSDEYEFTDLDFWIFPTNEERLKYRDDMLNRTHLWGTTSIKDSLRRGRL